jgi:tight adherence protein B
MGLAAVTAASMAVWTAGAAHRSAGRRLALAPPPAARRWLAVASVGGVAGAAAAAGTSPVVLLAAGGAVIVARRAYRRKVTRVARSRQESDVVLLCFALAAELRAGATAADALAAASGQLHVLGSGVAAAGRAVGHGALPHEELAALAAAERCPRLVPVAAVWQAGATTGARLADVLERVGRALADTDEAAAELDALSAGPRATASVLCVLPVLGVALGTAIGASPLPVLLHTGLGGALVGAAGALDACGVLWVRRITRSALEA